MGAWTCELIATPTRPHTPPSVASGTVDGYCLAAEYAHARSVSVTQTRSLVDAGGSFAAVVAPRIVAELPPEATVVAMTPGTTPLSDQPLFDVTMQRPEGATRDVRSAVRDWTSITAPAGGVTACTYDSSDRVTKVEQCNTRPVRPELR